MKTQPVLDTEQVRELLLSIIETLRNDAAAYAILDISCDPDWLGYFYTFENRELIWFDHQGLGKDAEVLIHLIQQAELQGLEPDDYHVGTITKLYDCLKDGHTPDISDTAKMELLLTDAFFLFGLHLSEGRIDPAVYDFDWHIAKPAKNNADAFYEILDHGKLAGFVEKLEPKHTGYLKLKQALANHVRIKDAGGWAPVPNGKKLRLGSCSKRVTALKKRLVISGDLTLSNQGRYDYFDKTLEDAVRSFQYRHGLKADGVVGRTTRAVLNVPVEDWISRIKLNMERWRWLPESLGDAYVMVNTAGFQIQVVENQQTVKTIKAIVGKKDRPTPILSGQITYLELNPYWNIPHAIALKDILPKIRKDPAYLSENKIRVFESWRENAKEIQPENIDWTGINKRNFHFKLRQEPSWKNALGQLKFMFPNEFAVYMHDTPSHSLFNRNQRTFSSGCVRVEKPVELAGYLLDKYSRVKAGTIQADIDSRKRKIMRLAEPVNIHILYWTAWVADDGTVQFRDDVYGKDSRLRIALNGEPEQIQVASVGEGKKNTL